MENFHTIFSIFFWFMTGLKNLLSHLAKNNIDKKIYYKKKKLLLNEFVINLLTLNLKLVQFETQDHKLNHKKI